MNGRWRASRGWRGGGVAWLAMALTVALLTSGCERRDIEVYKIPKEDAWVLPAGWSQRDAGAMRAARFTGPGRDGRDVDVSLIPLKGLPGGRADVINIWRSQLKLEPLGDEALAQMASKVPVWSGEAELYDMAGTAPMPDSGLTNRSLLVTTKRDDVSWFIKMSGEAGDVAAQRTNFLAFLKTLNLEGVSTATEQPGRSAAAKPEWTVPAGWQEAPPGQMLLAKFVIAGDGGAKADVNITMLEGDGGGLEQNVNRWRKQLGLEPVDEGGLTKMIQPLDLPSGKAILVEMNGTDARTGRPTWLIAAIVPRQEQTWFYRLMGDEKITAREKDALIKFLHSVKYPNG